MSSTSALVRLVLAEHEDAPGQAASWIGPLLALGTRAARYIDREPQRQLIVAVSVPSRDFAAALIGCGWVLASEAPTLADPLTTLRSLELGTPVRAVTSRDVMTGNFSSLDEFVSPPRANFAGSIWELNRIRSLIALDELEYPERTPRPEPGDMGRMAQLEMTWDARLAAPAADLAMVGTVSWLEEDFDACVGREGGDRIPSSIRNLILPDLGRVATWFTRVYTAARFADQLPLPDDLRCVILDGAGATKYLGEVEAPVVICILDRSVADETAAEVVVQLRNTRGEPLSIQQDLGWNSPIGVEALAFTVPL